MRIVVGSTRSLHLLLGSKGESDKCHSRNQIFATRWTPLANPAQLWSIYLIFNKIMDGLVGKIGTHNIS